MHQRFRSGICSSAICMTTTALPACSSRTATAMSGLPTATSSTLSQRMQSTVLELSSACKRLLMKSIESASKGKSLSISKTTIQHGTCTKTPLPQSSIFLFPC
ncbi:hypothetical protein BDW74DRAFT_163608 [Aspergillus multicolor]|uniref:uncharacterized protein n=1 Tax=Aspergillus multicolor TaxID=41759 RepID=UPI003CCD95C5